MCTSVSNFSLHDKTFTEFKDVKHFRRFNVQEMLSK